ncbi:glycosyltransferase family 4 protein [Grimontia marina]|uniref:Capsular glucan synthase n=1 Tax=Grimontia marina TaxID=646534 RepID=A0A128ETP8_9GAMM|nr:glycosyltransferase family 4 protein [Grimontia marina]CZF77475.1 Capsular glucan synthase [Grimontia marina]
MKEHIITIGTGANGGIDSVIKGYEKDGLFDSYSHIRIVSHLGKSKFHDLWLFLNALLSLFKVFLKLRVKILHCHMSYKGSFWRKLTFVLIAKLFNVRTLVHLHGSEFKQYYSSRTNLTKNSILWLIRNVDEFVVLSDSWKLYIEGISGRNVTSINNYVNINNVSTSRLEGHILFLAAFIPRKGIYDLLNACALLNRDFHLHLCGAGEDEKVRQLVGKLNLTESVTFHGWVDGSTKKDLLSKCSVMILPSYNEGLPMTLIESLGCKIPVISTPVGAISEVILDGETGYLVEPGSIDQIADKLNHVLSSPPELKAIVDNGHRKYVENFTSEVILPKWQSIYEKMS